MKLTKYLLPAALAALMTACDTCDMNPVLPPVNAPVDTTAANMTILQLKQRYWSIQTWNSSANNVTEIGLTDEGDSILLRGRVISTDVSGNLYKQLVISDGTAALTLPLGISDSYKVYPQGTEMVVNVTGLYAGNYHALFQVGIDDYAANSSHNYPYQISEDDAAYVFSPDGWPEVDSVQPLVVDLAYLNSIKTSATGLQEWQSQLVTFNDMTFETPGQEFSPTYSSTTSVYAKDPNGNRLQMRYSGRSTFAHQIIPLGTGSITGILSYYGSDWQLIPLTADDLQGFTDGTGAAPEAEGTGTEDDPYNVTAAMSNQSGTGWVKGYIVGTMNSSNDYTLEVVAPFTVASNVYIADDPMETVSSMMLPVQLVSGTTIRSEVNLVDHPENLGKILYIEGTLTSYFSQPGLKEPTAYKLEGEGGGTAGESGSGSSTSTTVTCTQALTIADGDYILWADNKIGTAFTDGYSYGYMQTTDCTPAADGTITASSANLFTFKQESQGWTIADSHGQYLYQDGTHTSFQLSKTLDSTNTTFFWSITADATGVFTIVNNGTQNIVQYDPNYKTWAGYDSVTGTLPHLFQPEI